MTLAPARPPAPTRRPRRDAVHATAIVAAGALAVALLANAAGGTTPTISDTPPPDFDALIASVQVAPDLPYVPPGQPGGYDRDGDWGAWAAIPGPTPGNTRDAVLARDLDAEHVDPEGTVTSGTLREDPYSGLPASGDARQWDIDHRVPPALAWRDGAQSWPRERRVAFYNDPRNLVTVNLGDNREKGDSGPEEWLPDVHRCAYAVAFLQVVRDYALTATPERLAAIRLACGR